MNKKQENSSSLMVILNLNGGIKIHSTFFHREDDYYMTSLKLHTITIITNRQPKQKYFYTCFKFNSKYKLKNLTINKHTSKKIFHLKKQSN